MKQYWLMVVVLLASCATQSPVGNSCVQNKSWTDKEQDAVLAAEKQLPADSILIPVLEDYIRMRHGNS